MKKIGLIYHQDYLEHNTGHHPENKYRLIYTLKHLQKSFLKKHLIYISPLKADEKYLQLIHTQKYIDFVKKSCKNGNKFIEKDTPICENSFNVALLAVGGVFSGIDAVMKQKVSSAFVLLRPPGHHAEKDKAMGFCLFNNIAIGAKYIQQKYNIQKIFIIDFDVHHGNGTQQAFYEDPSIFFTSIHQYPFYPGTGNKNEIGEKKGKGFTLNIPLSVNSGNEEYEKNFEKYIFPEIKKFKPDFFLISAGFDAYEQDPLSNMNLTIEGFNKIGKLISEISNIYSNGKIVSILEGGYNINKLPYLIEAYLEAFI
ncbi:MAG: histone deacetylase [bacterium]